MSKPTSPSFLVSICDLWSPFAFLLLDLPSSFLWHLTPSLVRSEKFFIISSDCVWNLKPEQCSVASQGGFCLLEGTWLFSVTWEDDCNQEGIAPVESDNFLPFSFSICSLRVSASSDSTCSITACTVAFSLASFIQTADGNTFTLSFKSGNFFFVKLMEFILCSRRFSSGRDSQFSEVLFDCKHSKYKSAFFSVTPGAFASFLSFEEYAEISCLWSVKSIVVLWSVSRSPEALSNSPSNTRFSSTYNFTFFTPTSRSYKNKVSRLQLSYSSIRYHCSGTLTFECFINQQTKTIKTPYQ